MTWPAWQQGALCSPSLQAIYLSSSFCGEQQVSLLLLLRGIFSSWISHLQPIFHTHLSPRTKSNPSNPSTTSPTASYLLCLTQQPPCDSSSLPKEEGTTWWLLGQLLARVSPCWYPLIGPTPPRGGGSTSRVPGEPVVIPVGFLPCSALLLLYDPSTTWPQGLLLCWMPGWVLSDISL